MPKNTYQNAEEMNKYRDMKFVLDGQDLKWFEDECARIEKMTGYQLGRRASGTNGLMLYLLAEKDYTLEQLKDLNKLPKEEFKKLAEEFFREVGDPKKTPEENARRSGEIHRKGMEKVLKMKIPTPDLSTREAAGALHEDLLLFQALFFDLSQDTEKLRTTTNGGDPSLVRAYLDGYGGAELLTENDARIHIYRQSVKVIFDILHSGEFREDGQAMALDALRQFFEKFGGKTIGELPRNLHNWMDAAGMAIKTTACPTAKPDAELKNPQAHQDYLEGKAQNYPKQAQFMTALQSVFSGSMESHNGHTRSALNKFSTRSFEGYMNALPNPANPADPADLLQLPEEKLQGLETAYVETFGTCFRDEALEPLADMGLKPWDVIKTPDGKTIHDIVEEKYAGRTNAEKARVMMAETMRTLLSSPEGVRVRIPVMNPKDGSITISGETVVRRLPLSLVQTYTCTPVKKQGNRIITQADAEHFLEAPEGELRNGDPMYFKERINPEVNGVYRFFSNQKPLLEKHGLDVLDCVFVGEKSLKELYHDKYEAMHPNLEGDQLLELMETVLFAESFNPDTPIYLASLSETPEGELRRSVVPVTLRVTGAQTVPGQDRETKADEVRAFGENALKNREQEAYREQSRTELLEREAKRLDGPEGQRRLENEWERRLGILSLRASLITPSSREYLRRTLEVMEPMREQMAETVRQIQLLERAADCTSDEKLRRSMREQAGTLRKNPPVSDYEKLLTGLEYAYGLRGVKSAAEIPMELHQFFEARTGYHIPQFIVESDLSYGAYRPLSVEIPASVFAGEDLKKKLPDYIRRVFLHEVFENANLRPKGLERTDQNDLILIGGKTLSELLKEQGRADAHRVLAQALLDGEPVEFFVGNGWPDRKCSSTPVSIRLEGAPVHVLSREETQQMEAGRQRILDGVKAKGLEIDQTSTEHLRAREQMRNRLAVQQYDGVIATDCCKTTDKGMSSILTVMQIFLFPDGVPKPNPAALDKLKPEERARQIGTIVGGRYSPTSYVIGRLAEESEKLRAQGKPGYTIDQIMDLNSLQEEKRRIAQEYREICESYDTVKYAVGLEQGMRAIVAMHRRAYPPEEIFQSEEMMKKAFLGRAGAFLSNALDSKQELKYEGNKDILVSTGRFKDREEVYAFQDWASDETIMMNVMSQYETAKRYATEKIDSTSSALESEASYGQVIDKIRKDILAGRDPYKGLFLFASSSRGDIVDMDEVQPVLPSLKPYTQKEAPMELVEGLASGKTLETLDLDYEELDRLKEEGKIQAMGEHIRPIARGEKLARDLAPLARVAFHKRVENSMAELRALFVNEQGGLREVSELSEEELGKASQLFDRIYQPYFDSMPVREYLQQNPGKTGMDLILIGSETAASRVELPAELGQAQREMAVKAQLLQFGMDPRMPIYTAGIGYDPKTGSYTLEGARLTMTRNDLRERVIQERPYLASLDTYIGQRILDDPDLSREDFSENEWNEMYEDQFRIAVENGLLPEKRIVHSDQMKAQAEEAGIPSVLHRLQIESLYGAEPTYVPEWCNRTYRRDEFTGLKVQDRGSFTNAQFAVLSYFAVMDPQSVTSDIAPETPNISNERKLRARVMNLTTDLRMDPPRQAFGRNFLRFAEEARDEVARAIQDLEDGQPEHLAGIIARGLKEAIPAIGAISSIQDPSADFACQAEMLKSLNQLLHSADERLSEAVEAQLTEEEKNLIKGILEIKRLMDESSLALKELEEEERGERAPFTEEERAQRRAVVGTFKEVADAWDAAMAKKDPEATARMEQKLAEHPVQRKNLNLQDEDITTSLLMAEANQETLHLVEEVTPLVQDDTKMQQISQRALAGARAVEAAKKALLDEMARIKAAEAAPIYGPGGAKKGEIDYAVTSEEYVRICEEKAAANYRFGAILDRIAEGLTKEQAKKIYNRMYAVEEANGWRHRVTLPKADRPISLVGQGIAYEQEEYIRAYADIIASVAGQDPAKHAELQAKIEGIRLPSEWTLEEMTEHTHAKQIEELKKNLKEPEDGQGMSVQEATQELDRANANLTGRKESAYSFLSEHSDPQRAQEVEEMQGVRDKDQFRGGAYSGMIRNVPFGTNGRSPVLLFPVMGEGKEGKRGELFSEPLEVSPETTQKFTSIAAKMKEFGMLTGSFQVEESTKIYSHKKLMAARDQLEAAVKKGNLQEIKACNAAYEAERDKTREIFRMIHEAFPGLKRAPGNVETIRNSKIPAEFSTDIYTDALANGIYQIAEFCEANKLDMETYLKNPAMVLYKMYMPKIMDEGFEAQAAKDASLADTINRLDENATMEAAEMKKRAGMPDVALVIKRVLDGFILLEPDAQKRAELQKQKIQIIEQFNTIFDREGLSAQVVAYFQAPGFAGDFSQEDRDAMRAGLKEAFLEGGPLRKKHLPLPNTDDEGKVIPKVSGYQDLLQAPDRYAYLKEQYQKNLPGLQKRSTDLLAGAVEEALIDYLEAHPEDMEKKEYKELETLALGMHAQLGLTDSTRREQYLVYRAAMQNGLKPLTDKAQKADRDLNTELTKLQNSLKTAQGEAREALLQEMRDLIQERQAALRDGFRIGEISETYLRARDEQLRHLLEAPESKPMAPPAFVNPASPESKSEVCHLLASRAKQTIYPAHLKSLEAFITWKTSVKADAAEMAKDEVTQSTLAHFGEVGEPLISRDEFTPEEWEALYRSELIRTMRNQPLPQGIAEVAQLSDVERAAAADRAFEEEILRELGVSGEVQLDDEQQMSLQQVKQLSVQRIATTLTGNMPDPNTNPEAGAEPLGRLDTLYFDIALVISAGIMERRGLMPENKDLEQLARQMSEESNFRNVVKPLLEEVYQEERSLQANPEANQQNREAAQRLIEMIEDRTILRAFGMEHRVAKQDLALNSQGKVVSRSAAADSASLQKGAGQRYIQEQMEQAKKGGPKL